jgi:hypothetical protein
MESRCNHTERVLYAKMQGPSQLLTARYAFLPFTCILLFFFPRGGIVNQIESTLFGILGASLGLAWQCLVLAVAAYCGRTYGADSDTARAILGLGLAILALVCELAQLAYRSYSDLKLIQTRWLRKELSAPASSCVEYSSLLPDLSSHLPAIYRRCE